MRNKSYREHTTQKSRLSFLMIAIVVLFSVLTVRLFLIQVVYHPKYLALAKKQQWISKQVPAKRGKIFTKEPNGEKYPLALNESKAMVYAVPKQVKNAAGAAEGLAGILGIPKEELQAKLADKSDFYVPLKHKLTDTEAKKIQELGIDGINLEWEDWRTYPEDELSASVLGFVNQEGNGQYGLEEYFNNELKGISGKLFAKTDASRKIPILGASSILGGAEDGADITITIDRVVQSKAERLLKEGVEKHKAAGGSAIVMDPETGKILAMTSWPSFNPNDFSNVSVSSFKNEAVSSIWEPGSIFKVITMLSGNDSGKITPETTFTDPGSVTVGGFPIKNSDLKAHGKVTMTYVLEQSLNVGAVWVQQQLGKAAFWEYLDKFGFGSKTGIEVAGEASGKLAQLKGLGDGDIARMSFGQAIAVTPIQAITGLAVAANGGKLVKPYLVSEISYPDGRVQKFQPQVVRQVVSKEAADKTAAMMVSVVERGHGKQAKVKGYRIAGKTGTAQVPRVDGKGYETSKTIGSFVLFAPVPNPKFIILVKIDNPKGVQFAESTAAPVAGKLAQELLSYWGIAPNE